jgi:hypothetical protein
LRVIRPLLPSDTVKTFGPLSSEKVVCVVKTTGKMKEGNE